MISDSLREEFTRLLREYVPHVRIVGIKVTGGVPWREDEHPSFSADL